MNRKYDKETQQAIDKAWPVFLGAMIICGIMCVIIGSGILAFTLHVGSMHKDSVRSSMTWQDRYLHCLSQINNLKNNERNNKTTKTIL